MSTISISDDILNQVMQTSGLTNKNQAVTFALQAFINKGAMPNPVPMDMERMQQAIDSAQAQHQTLKSTDNLSVESIRQSIINASVLSETKADPVHTHSDTKLKRQAPESLQGVAVVHGDIINVPEMTSA